MSFDFFKDNYIDITDTTVNSIIERIQCSGRGRDRYTIS